jgi:hypothetical protein
MFPNRADEIPMPWSETVITAVRGVPGGIVEQVAEYLRQSHGSACMISDRPAGGSSAADPLPAGRGEMPRSCGSARR